MGYVRERKTGITVFTLTFWVMICFIVGLIIGRFVFPKKNKPPFSVDTINQLKLRIMSLEDSLDCVSWHYNDINKRFNDLENNLRENE